MSRIIPSLITLVHDKESQVKLKQLAQLVSLVCIAGPVIAQTTTSAPNPNEPPKPAPKTERIEVTGSNIKRAPDENAQPIQVISREDIERAGITSAEQLVATISANGNGGDNLSSNVGVINLGPEFRNNFGNASANLRGLGTASTLVLLNGRRVSTHGAKGNSVDLSTIPLAAIQRVEILKDGASAIYGTDAIGGVINFIMRKDFTGLQVTGFADVTEKGGGNIFRGNITGGWGTLGKDRYNIMANLTWDEQKILNPDQRREFVNGFQPERGLSPDTVGAQFATVRTGTGSALPGSFTTAPALGNGNTLFTRANLLSFQGNCEAGGQFMTQYQFQLWATPSFRYACAYDYAGQQVILQPLKRYNAVARGTFEITPQHTLISEFVGYKTNATRAFEYSQISALSTAIAYPVTGAAHGPMVQALRQFIPSINVNAPLFYSWRCIPCGRRTIETDTEAYRGLLALEGTISSWDYKVGVSTAKSEANSTLLDGYMRNTDFNALLASGLLNPFLLPGQSQTAAAMAAVEAAKAKGVKLFGGEATLRQFDGTVSGELFKLPAGPLAVALGFDSRKESYKFRDDSGSAPTGGVRDAPFDAAINKVSRTIQAVYAEAVVPLFKNAELTAAIRRDKYSDFGSTTNPKVSLKFSPSQHLLLRGSYSEGFRAPSFFQLYTPESEAIVPGNLADPVLCPQRPTDPAVCAIRPLARQGGNRNLQPETSKQWVVGFVLTPTTWLSTSVDMWQIRRKDLITILSPQQVAANFSTFPENFVRGATGRLDEQGGFIRAGYVNADGDILRGLEFGAEANTRIFGGRLTGSFNGTYLDSVKSRIFVTQAYSDLVGVSSTTSNPNLPTLYIRWKHSLSTTFSKGNWSGTLSQNFTGRYKDWVPFAPPPGFNTDVRTYVVHNVSVGYTGFKNLTLRFGIKNLFNELPSFTAHNVDFSPGAGWEARVADPRLRAYTLNATYKF
jgi:iron complex outermembrane receptor protein